MAKDINDLTANEFNALFTVLSVHISTNMIAIIRLAKTYQLDKNELAFYWLYLSEKFVNSTDLNKKRVLTVNEGMELLKRFLNLKERKENETN